MYYMKLLKFIFLNNNDFRTERDIYLNIENKERNYLKYIY